MPFVGLSMLLLCLFPGIALWLPDEVMGTK
jgi:hypothetical protein